MTTIEWLVVCWLCFMGGFFVAALFSANK